MSAFGQKRTSHDLSVNILGTKTSGSDRLSAQKHMAPRLAVPSVVTRARIQHQEVAAAIGISLSAAAGSASCCST